MFASTKRRKHTVPTVARELGVANRKVLDWIKSGELRAVNLARSADGRPRYAIDVEDLARFEESRAVVPNVGATPRLRRRAAAGVKEFF
jgi:excisionase family DNA binding protein